MSILSSIPDRELTRLYHCEGSIVKTAALLHCPETTLYTHIKRRNIPIFNPFIVGRKGKGFRISWDKNQLTKWYWDECKSPSEIAKLVGCSYRETVIQAMKRLQIPLRNHSDAGVLHRANHPRYGDEGSNWHGGQRRLASNGYVYIYLHPNDQLVAMRNKTGMGLEHRIVMARKLGRALLKTEHVHHINGIRDDNRLENLKLVSPLEHGIYTSLCAKCSLRKEIRLLKWQIRNLQSQIQGVLLK